MKRKLLILTLAFLPALHGMAKEVSAEQAAEKALEVLTAKEPGFRGVVSSVEAVSHAGEKAYYVVQFSQGGWALIAADDRSAPLLGYSAEGTFLTTGQPENVRAMLDSYGEQVVSNAREDGPSHSGWRQSASARKAAPMAASSNKVSPLVTVNWNQSGSYSKYCPSDANGQAVVGCVAVAMAQAMSVVQYPARPVGEFSYTSKTYGSMYINYDAQAAYNWSAILSGANNKDEVARLLYHCGVSVSMDYSPSGSGAQASAVAAALKRNFSYPQSVKYYSRNSYDGDWSQLILDELTSGRAVAYCGQDTKKGYGHCFNLDGYDGSFFHVNWGWGGSNNGYFSLDGLKDATMDMDYTDGQGVIVGIRPPSENPSNITLSNKTVGESLPVGTVVGTVTVESEAVDPVYTYTIKGPYSIILHTNLPAPFKVVNGQLVTTEVLSASSGNRTIDITATNTQTGASVTRQFTIRVLSVAGIEASTSRPEPIATEYYTPSGTRLSAPRKGLTVVRERLSDGSVRSFKINQ